jgi:tetratricopeptide (TPR) repeat protein
MMSNSNGYRYPGSRPFEDTYLDRRLFFGREKEKEALLHKVLAKRLVVLYAKSGLGKTSLINAGVNELLREKGCVPLKIRFNDANMHPVQAVFEGIKKTIEQHIEQHNIDYELGEEKTLWQYFKTAAFWSSRNSLLTPVLILDQFEEFFTFHSPDLRKDFIVQLADLFHGTIPAELRKAMKPEKPFPYSEHPPSIKILISIREDFLGHLDELSGEIPDILHNRFRLTALTRNQAREAITEPSQVIDDRILTSNFDYKEDAVEMILNFLCEQKERGGSVLKDEVESFQLQLICRSIENKLSLGVEGENANNNFVVRKEDIGGQIGMKKILQNFYYDTLTGFESMCKKRRIRKMCEKGLISFTDRRLPLEEEEIVRRFKLSRSILAELVNSRLLRAEKRLGSVYYELSHDSLVEPIRESQGYRKTGIIFYMVSALIPILIISLIVYGILKGSLQSVKEIDKTIRNLEHSYLNAINLDKKNVQANIEIARLYILIGRYKDSIKICTEAIHNGVKNANIYYELGNAIFKDLNLEKAIEFAPNRPGPYEGLTYFKAKEKKFKDAIEYYEKALGINPKNPDAYEKLAILFIEKGEFDEAMKVYQRALNVDIGYAIIYRRIAEVLIDKGEESWLEELIDSASKIDSEDETYYFDLGDYCSDLKKYDKSIENYKKAIKIYPDYAKAYRNMGFVFYKQKKYDEAIENYKKALNIKPDLEEAHEYLGLALTAQGKHDEAIENYNKALKINPDDNSVYNNMGYTLIKQGKYEDAIGNLKKALEINPDDASTYKNMGVAYYYKKEFDIAIDNYKKALEIDSKLIPAKAGLAKVYLITEHFDEAYKLANEVLKEKEVSIRNILEMRFISIASLLLQEKKTEALSHVKEFLKYYRSITVVLEQGWIYSNIKNFIRLNIKLKGLDRTLLFRMIDILESPKAEGDKRLKELEEFLEIYE